MGLGFFIFLFVIELMLSCFINSQIILIASGTDRERIGRRVPSSFPNYIDDAPANSQSYYDFPFNFYFQYNKYILVLVFFEFYPPQYFSVHGTPGGT